MVKLCIKIADIIHYNIPHHLAHSLYHPMKPPSNNELPFAGPFFLSLFYSG